MLKVTHVLNLNLLDNKAPALSFTTLPYIGRDDGREGKEERKDPGSDSRTEDMQPCEIGGSECQTQVLDVPLQMAPNLYFLPPRFQEGSRQVSLGHLVSSAWNKGRSSLN